MKIKPLKVLGADVIFKNFAAAWFQIFMVSFFSEFVGRLGLSFSFLFLPFFAIPEVNNVWCSVCFML